MRTPTIIGRILRKLRPRNTKDRKRTGPESRLLLPRREFEVAPARPGVLDHRGRYFLFPFGLKGSICGGCGLSWKSYRPGSGFSTTSIVSCDVSGLTYFSSANHLVKYGFFSSTSSAASMLTRYAPGGAPSRAPVMIV